MTLRYNLAAAPTVNQNKPFSQLGGTGKGTLGVRQVRIRTSPNLHG